MPRRAHTQLEGALLEAKAEVARLKFDRDDVVAAARQRHATRGPSVHAQYREGFSDGAQVDSTLEALENSHAPPARRGPARSSLLPTTARSCGCARI